MATDIAGLYAPWEVQGVDVVRVGEWGRGGESLKSRMSFTRVEESSHRFTNEGCSRIPGPCLFDHSIGRMCGCAGENPVFSTRRISISGWRATCPRSSELGGPVSGLGGGEEVMG